MTTAPNGELEQIAPSAPDECAADEHVRIVQRINEQLVHRVNEQLVLMEAQRAEIARLRKETRDLRGSVIWVCDAVQRVHTEQRTIRAVRQAANQLTKAFDLDAIVEATGLDVAVVTVDDTETPLRAELARVAPVVEAAKAYVAWLQSNDSAESGSGPLEAAVAALKES